MKRVTLITIAFTMLLAGSAFSAEEKSINEIKKEISQLRYLMAQTDDEAVFEEAAEKITQKRFLIIDKAFNEMVYLQYR